MRPRLRLSSGSAVAAAKKPRTLKLPVGWRHSSLRSAPSTGTRGVLWTYGRARSAAARMRSNPITPTILNDADLRVPLRGVRQALIGPAGQLLVSRPGVPPLRQAGAQAPGVDIRDGAFG